MTSGSGDIKPAQVLGSNPSHGALVWERASLKVDGGKFALCDKRLAILVSISPCALSRETVLVVANGEYLSQAEVVERP
jgi:hypothetical protein